MLTEKCRICQNGKEQIDIYKKMKNKEINKIDCMNKLKEYGAICISCEHNGIGGIKGRILRKKYSAFKTFDQYVPRKDGGINE